MIISIIELIAHCWPPNRSLSFCLRKGAHKRIFLQSVAFGYRFSVTEILYEVFNGFLLVSICKYFFFSFSFWFVNKFYNFKVLNSDNIVFSTKNIIKFHMIRLQFPAENKQNSLVEHQFEIIIRFGLIKNDRCIFKIYIIWYFHFYH